jgi:hypothetical protein
MKINTPTQQVANMLFKTYVVKYIYVFFVTLVRFPGRIEFSDISHAKYCSDYFGAIAQNLSASSAVIGSDGGGLLESAGIIGLLLEKIMPFGGYSWFESMRGSHLFPSEKAFRHCARILGRCCEGWAMLRCCYADA